MQNVVIFKLRPEQETVLWWFGFVYSVVDNKYPRALQGLRTDWIRFFMFPFVILSQKRGIKRYKVQFGGKEKHCTSLQSLKTSSIFFSFKKQEGKSDYLH